jgi:amino-acid N-acetyltransferase
VTAVVEPSAERDFFISEFRHRTLLIVLQPDADGDAALDEGFLATIGELVANDTRVALFAPRVGPPAASAVAEHFGMIAQPVPGNVDELADLWIALTEQHLVVLAVDGDVAAQAADVAGNLRAEKLVLTDPAGGWGDPPRSFADPSDLDDDPGGRTAVAAAVRHALVQDVPSINLCRPAELDAELFTFDGAGTLFTRDAYVRVSPLSLDDLPVVEELVQRGVAEGFLRPRERHEVVRVAFGGLCARVARSGHVVGIGSLETDRYRPERVGEVACLYTVSRFAGEGAGGQLLEGLVAAAMDRGLRAVFACTVSEHAAAFFERHGFAHVPQEHLPAIKWDGYDEARRSNVRSLWLDLEVHG